MKRVITSYRDEAVIDCMRNNGIEQEMDFSKEDIPQSHSSSADTSALSSYFNSAVD